MPTALLGTYIVRILRLHTRGRAPHESLGSQPSPVHGKLGDKSAAEDRTTRAFRDLRGQNAIISDACRGAITLGDQSFAFEPGAGDDFGLAAGQMRALWLIITDRYVPLTCLCA